MLYEGERDKAMRIHRVAALALIFLWTVTARAVHIWEDPGGWAGGIFAYNVNVPKYTAQELSLDAFGSYIARQRNIEHLFDTSIKDHRGWWGGGVGLNYFITRYLGISGDVNMPADGGKLIDDVFGSLILRLPLDPSGFAPYVFGGGGRQIEGWQTVVSEEDGTVTHDYGTHWEWEGHAGVGIEYRFNPTTGIFMDGRYIWTKNTDDKLLLRAGLRLVF